MLQLDSTHRTAFGSKTGGPAFDSVDPSGFQGPSLGLRGGHPSQGPPGASTGTRYSSGTFHHPPGFNSLPSARPPPPPPSPYVNLGEPGSSGGVGSLQTTSSLQPAASTQPVSSLPDLVSLHPCRLQQSPEVTQGLSQAPRPASRSASLFSSGSQQNPLRASLSPQVASTIQSPGPLQPSGLLHSSPGLRISVPSQGSPLQGSGALPGPRANDSRLVRIPSPPNSSGSLHSPSTTQDRSALAPGLCSSASQNPPGSLYSPQDQNTPGPLYASGGQNPAETPYFSGGQSSYPYSSGGQSSSGALYPRSQNSSGGLYPRGGQSFSGGLYPTESQSSSGALYPTGQSSSGALYPTGGQSSSGGLYPSGGQNTPGGLYPTGQSSSGALYPTGQSSSGTLYPTGGPNSSGALYPTGAPPAGPLTGSSLFPFPGTLQSGAPRPPTLQPLPPGAHAGDRHNVVVHWTQDGHSLNPVSDDKSDEDDDDDDESPPCSPLPPRERLSYTRAQLRLLNAIFAQVRYPNTMQKKLIGRRAGITRDQVKIWFQNRRRKDVVSKQQAEGGKGGKGGKKAGNKTKATATNSVASPNSAEETSVPMETDSASQRSDGGDSTPKPAGESSTSAKASDQTSAPDNGQGTVTIAQVGETGGMYEIPLVINSVVAEIKRYAKIPPKATDASKEAEKKKKAKKAKKAAKKAAQKAATATATATATAMSADSLRSGLTGRLFQSFDMASPPNTVTPMAHSLAAARLDASGSRFTHSSHSSAFQNPRAGPSGLGLGGGGAPNTMGGHGLLGHMDPVSLMPQPFGQGGLNALGGDFFHPNPGGSLAPGVSAPSTSTFDYPVLMDMMTRRGGMEMSGRGGSYGSSMSALPSSSQMVPHPSQQYPPFPGQDFMSGMMGNPNRVYPFPFVAEAPVMLSTLRYPDAYCSLPHPSLPGTSSQDPYQPLTITSYRNPFLPNPSTSSQDPRPSWPGPSGNSYSNM